MMTIGYETRYKLLLNELYDRKGKAAEDGNAGATSALIEVIELVQALHTGDAETIRSHVDADVFAMTTSVTNTALKVDRDAAATYYSMYSNAETPGGGSSSDEKDGISVSATLRRMTNDYLQSQIKANTELRRKLKDTQGLLDYTEKIIIPAILAQQGTIVLPANMLRPGDAATQHGGKEVQVEQNLDGDLILRLE